MLNFDGLIRRLAKCNYYQTIYSQEKNLGMRLFRNESDLTYAQIVFLNHLAFYSALNMDYFMGEVDDRVFESEIREDAYMYFRKQNKQKSRDNIKTPTGQKPKEKPVTSQWVFTTPKKVK